MRTINRSVRSPLTILLATAGLCGTALATETDWDFYTPEPALEWVAQSNDGVMIDTNFDGVADTDMTGTITYELWIRAPFAYRVNLFASGSSGTAGSYSIEQIEFDGGSPYRLPFAGNTYFDAGAVEAFPDLYYSTGVGIGENPAADIGYFGPQSGDDWETGLDLVWYTTNQTLMEPRPDLFDNGDHGLLGFRVTLPAGATLEGEIAVGLWVPAFNDGVVHVMDIPPLPSLGPVARRSEEAAQSFGASVMDIDTTTQGIADGFLAFLSEDVAEADFDGDGRIRDNDLLMLLEAAGFDADTTSKRLWNRLMRAYYRDTLMPAMGSRTRRERTSDQRALYDAWKGTGLHASEVDYDIDGSGRVDVGDLASILETFFSRGKNLDADLDRDGRVWYPDAELMLWRMGIDISSMSSREWSAFVKRYYGYVVAPAFGEARSRGEASRDQSRLRGAYRYR